MLTKTGENRWSCKPASGGLVSALVPVLQRYGGDWVGWPGTAARDSGGLKRFLRTLPHARYGLHPVMLSADEIQQFYHGFSNEIIWPLFHDLFTRCNFDSGYCRTYEHVNRKFAAEIAKISGPSNLIWVQDYHLMNVARELRAIGSSNPIGFFLHIPFPPPDIFLKLPWRREILLGLLTFDQLGFQIARDRRNFLHCVQAVFENVEAQELGAMVHITVDKQPDIGREIHVGSFPH